MSLLNSWRQRARSFACAPFGAAALFSVVVACGSGDHPRPGDALSDAGVDAAAADASATQRDDASEGDTAVDARTMPYTDAALPFPSNAAGQVLCGTAPCACSDGVDNDADGVTDLNDPECVSPWDDDESSFATGISGDNRDDACQDCFFDGNSGSGNDGCRLPSSCLRDGTASSGHGSCSSCEQTDQCKSFCTAYTPNGCDCFGCCGVNVAGTVHHVLVAEGCQIDGDTLTDCTECVPSTSCGNPCGECELCPGKTAADLPARCAETSPDGGYTCEQGSTRCGDTLPACAEGEACTYGCCVLLPIIR